MRHIIITLGLIALSGCNLVRPDNFVCGEAQEDSTGGAAFCAGEEVCVCSQQRCAEPVPPTLECPSGLKFSFGDRECVHVDELPTVLYGGTSGTYCSQESQPAPPCGAGDAGLCDSQSLCLRGVRDQAGTLTTPARQCVRRDDACDAGFKLVSNGTCVIGGPRSALIVRGSDDPFCPGVEPFPRTCGNPLSRNDRVCPKGAACLCGASGGVSLTLAANTCIFRNEDCKATGLPLSDIDGRCLTGATDAGQLVLLLDGGTVCPNQDVGSLFPDAGTPPPRCGIPLDAGVRDCGVGAACLCNVSPDAGVALNVEPYACVTANADCTLAGGVGLLTERGECVGAIPREQLVLRFRDGGICPGFDIDDFRPRDAGTPDGGDAGTADAGVDGGVP